MFFEGARASFFRPLSGKYREMVATCLQTLYLRLHGPAADYTALFTREDLRDLFATEIAHHAPLDGDGEAVPDDPHERATLIIRALIDDGWIEEHRDRAALRKTLRFSRAGKRFAEALAHDRLGGLKSRQRNVRNARNALEAFVRDADPFNLIDCAIYADRVASDLTDDIEDLGERRAQMLQQAAEHSAQAIADFVSYMDRVFIPDLAVRLSADSVERHKGEILRLIRDIRERGPADRAALSERLRPLVGEFAEACAGDDILDGLLSRIERTVTSACRAKMPELRRALSGFVRRSQMIVASAYALAARRESMQAMNALRRATPAQRDAMLAGIADRMLPRPPELIDPGALRLPGKRAERVYAAEVDVPVPTRAQLRDAAIRRALDDAFAVDLEDLRAALLEQLGSNPGIAASDLLVSDARTLLLLSHIIELLGAGVPNADPRLVLRSRLDATGAPRTFAMRYGEHEDVEVSRAR